MVITLLTTLNFQISTTKFVLMILTSVLFGAVLVGVTVAFPGLYRQNDVKKENVVILTNKVTETQENILFEEEDKNDDTKHMSWEDYMSKYS